MGYYANGYCESFKNFSKVRNLDENYIILFLGDFNVPGINWSCMSSASVYECNILETLPDHGFNQFFDKPTHTKGNILDPMWSNLEVLSFEILAIVFADHYPLNFTTSTKLNSPRIYQSN